MLHSLSPRLNITATGCQFIVHFNAHTPKPLPSLCGKCVWERFLKLLGILDPVICLVGLLPLFLSSVTPLAHFLFFCPSHEPEFTLALYCIFHEFLKSFFFFPLTGLFLFCLQSHLYFLFFVPPHHPQSLPFNRAPEQVEGAFNKCTGCCPLIVCAVVSPSYLHLQRMPQNINCADKSTQLTLHNSHFCSRHCFFFPPPG